MYVYTNIHIYTHTYTHTYLHIIFTHSSIDGYLHHFHIFAIVNDAAVNIDWVTWIFSNWHFHFLHIIISYNFIYDNFNYFI